MGMRSPDVDAYIRNAQPFAQPILTRIRERFHRGCPGVQEKLKWSVPSFEYKGMLGGMAAFKHHATWGLWKASLLNDTRRVLETDASSPMAAGKYTDVSQLPPEEDMVELIRQAVELNERGVKLPQRRRTADRPPPKTPADLAAALKRNARAAATFTNFSASHKRQYIEWITEARQERTRRRRVAQAIEWMAQGRPRNWKYMRRK